MFQSKIHITIDRIKKQENNKKVNWKYVEFIILSTIRKKTIDETS